MTVQPRDCFDGPARFISFDAARRAARALVRPLGSVEVPLAAALGRVLAQPLKAPRPLPPFDQAAMDGYAVAAAGRSGMPLLLPAVGRTEAGDTPATLFPGSAHRIMTGAAMPSGADAVVMQEDAVLKGGLVRIPPGIVPGTHVRRAGEDVREGATVLEAGRTVGWPEIALLAALGSAAVPVAATVRIACLATGRELRRAGEASLPGAVYDSNGPMLAALLAAPGVEVATLAVGDETAAIAEALAGLAGRADIVVTTAGMADGSRDHVRTAVVEAGGRLDVVRVAMKPGKPLALGRLGGAAFVGLPGNPQAAAFAALAFLRPMIARLAGAPPAGRLTARLASAAATKPGRTELIPVRLAVEDGSLTAHRAGPEGSHRLAPMASADAVAVLPGAAEAIDAGTAVEVIPFDRLRFAG